MADSTRRVRPWLAALLTFLGWGVGLYYAKRTREAIYLAVGQILIIALIGGILISYLALNGPTKIPIENPSEFSAVDAISLLLSAFIAVGVWAYVSRHDVNVERASPARIWGYLAIWLLPIVGAVFAALLFRSFLLQPFNIPAASMKPTLQVGDYFAVRKWSYGYSRYSIAPFGGVFPAGRIFANQPERGDVLVFKNSKDGNRDYVKRLIGLPGDEIQMIGGLLHINGEPAEKEWIGNVGSDDCLYRSGSGPAPAYRETLPGGASYVVYECAGDNGPLDNVGPYLVPVGHYFMMGDNRDQSQDSRIIATVGYIPYDSLIGEAIIRSKATQ